MSINFNRKEGLLVLTRPTQLQRESYELNSFLSRGAAPRIYKNNAKEVYPASVYREELLSGFFGEGGHSRGAGGALPSKD